MGDCGACIVFTMVLIARDVSMGLLLVMAYVPRFFENTETSQTYCVTATGFPVSPQLAAIYMMGCELLVAGQ